MLFNSFISNSNKKLLFGLSLLLTTLLFLYGISYFVKRVDSNYVIGKSICEMSSLINDADVIVMGCSRSHQGIDPRILESQLQNKIGEDVKVYNFARPGMQAPFFYYILLDYLQNTEKKPKAVVINLSFYLLGGMDWMEDIYFSYYSPKLWQVLDAVDSNLISYEKGLQWYFKTKIPFLTHRKKFKTGVVENILSPKEIVLKSYIENRFYKKFQFDASNKGYFSRGSEKIKKEEDFSGFKKYSKGIENGYSVYTNYLEKFFELALKYNFKIIVYEFPWPVEAKSKELNTIIDYYQDIVREAAAENPNVIFVEDRFYWEKPLFADPLHLNQTGAGKLTNIVATWVEPYVSNKKGVDHNERN